MLCARHGRRPGWSGAETGAQARPGAGPRAGSGASRLEPVKKVVTQDAAVMRHKGAVYCSGRRLISS